MNAHTYIGVGFPCLHGYRCLAIPSDKQSRLGSHLLFVVWLQKEMIMELLEVKDELLNDGTKYTGPLLIENKYRLPHGYGKKEYPSYYVIGKFDKGTLNGPAYINHHHYMMTSQMKNNRGNGWGMMINGGVLTFGVYKSSQLVLNLTNFVEWYFDKILESNYRGTMFHYYPKTGEILIGIPSRKYDDTVSSNFMGFHFMDDGSVYVGTTASLKKTGPLIKFNNNGYIEIGKWVDGNLIEKLSISDILDLYWGMDEDDTLFASLLPPNMKRRKYNKISIDCNTNYFQGQENLADSAYHSVLNKKNTHNDYNGSYAQDVMGYDDATISDAFEGDPDAYWNID